MSITVRPVRPGDLIGMTRVILAARGLRGAQLERQMELDLTRFREQGLVEIIESDALIALEGSRMVGVMRYGEFEGDVHLTLPELDPTVAEEAVVDAFLRDFWSHMQETTERALFVDYPQAGGKTIGQAFVRNGFVNLVDRLDLRLQVRAEIEPGPGRLTFAGYEESNHRRFLAAFTRSFEGSLDPMMDWDARHPELSFEMFRLRFGQMEPQLWVLATDETGQDVGFALFQHFPGGRYAGDTVLLYTSVVPEARGQGYGEEIVREGLRRVRQVHGPSAHVSLTVSKPNVPAARIYQRLGFSPVEEFSVYKMARF